MNLGTLVTKSLGNSCDPGAASSLFIRDICSDSRIAAPGCLFVAIPGTKNDGGAYAKDAVAKGAIAVIAETALDLPPSTPVIIVPNARIALSRLAATFFGLSDLQSTGHLKVIAITGTNGKSTTALLIRSMLQAAGHTTALLGTIEYDLVSRKIASDLTTPDPITLTRHLVEAASAGATHAVMEVSSHSLDQHRTDGITFNAAVFTNLTQDHLDYHRTIDAYLLAKRRLFDNLGPRAVALINAEDPVAERMLEQCHAPVLHFAIGHPADIRGRILSEERDGTRFLVEYADQAVEMQTRLVGRHNVSNCLAAASVGVALNIDLEIVRRGIGQVGLVPGRLQRVESNGAPFDVFVDYAHTDDALRNVLTAVRPLTRNHLWCVFGCGGDRDRTKRPLMARAVADLADRFVITSDNPRTEDPLAIVAEIERGLSPFDAQRKVTIPDRARAIAHAINQLAPGDCLVIAGKGHENYQILGTRKIHFDDVEVAANALTYRANAPIAHSEGGIRPK